MAADAIDSRSVGEPARFQSLETLEKSLVALPRAPRDAGRVAWLVSRGEGGRRETPERVSLSPDAGLVGDAWGRSPKRKLDAQLAVMQADVARLIAHGQPLALFGDSLFFELDLSRANLPPGTRLRAGTTLVEVTPEPHEGCLKFRARFGADALRFVAKRELRHLNLRGIYLRVIEPGELSLGAPVEVVARAAPPSPRSG